MTHKDRLLTFAIRYPSGWHSFGDKNRQAKRALDHLVAIGALEWSEATKQFRLNLPPHTRYAIEHNGD